jgi:uncharacterized phage-associated protein
LKLQKLLYYVQGFHLAAFSVPLFKEKLFAWQYGPVVKEIYYKYKENGSFGIEPPRKEISVVQLFDEEGAYELFLDVLNVYGQYSAIKLMNLTHQELPWKNTKIDEEISHEKLKEYFSTRFED